MSLGVERRSVWGLSPLARPGLRAGRRPLSSRAWIISPRAPTGCTRPRTARPLGSSRGRRTVAHVGRSCWWPSAWCSSGCWRRPCGCGPVGRPDRPLREGFGRSSSGACPTIRRRSPRASRWSMAKSSSPPGSTVSRACAAGTSTPGERSTRSMSRRSSSPKG